MAFKISKELSEKLLSYDRSEDIFIKHPGMDSFNDAHGFICCWKLINDTAWADIYEETGIFRRKKSRKQYQSTMNRLLTNLYKAGNKKVGHLRAQANYKKGTFYRNEGMNYVITLESMKALSKAGLIKYGIGSTCLDAHYSYFQATDKLLAMFEVMDIKDSNISYNPKRTVYLREAKFEKHYTDDGFKEIETARDYLPVDYSIKRIKTLNNLLVKYNEFIQRLDITWDAPIEGMILHRLLTTNSRPDLNNKALLASFSGDMSHGGRMYKAFWVNMPKALRPYLQIEGEQLVDIDFNACHVELLYKKIGKKSPPDVYLYDKTDHNRSIAKTLMVTMLNFRAKPNRSEGQIRRDVIKATKLKDDYDVIKEILISVERHHEPINDYFYAGYGLSLQFQEAEIMRKIMKACMKQGIPILPCHDGCSVRVSDADTVEEIFRSVTDLPFSRDNMVEDKAGIINKGLKTIKDMEKNRGKMIDRGFTEDQLYRMNGSLLSLQARL